MPKIPLYNEGLGSTAPLAKGQLSPRANVQTLTAPMRARASFFDNASKVAFEFGEAEKARETDRIYAEEYMRLQDEGTTFNLQNKDTTMEAYQKNWDGFQTRAEGRVNTMNITKSQKASILQRLAPDFAKQNIAGKQNAYARGRNIASSAFQSVTNNDIESISNLPFMHPDRIAMRNKITDRTNDALKNDLDIGDFNPQFVDNQIEMLSATKSLNAANTLADIEGVDNLIAMSKNLTASDIKALNTDVETAKTRVRAEMIGALTATLSIDDIGTKVTTVGQIDDRRQSLLDGSAFEGRPDLQALYDDLDDIGRKQFLEQVNTKTTSMRTELTFRQGQEDRRIKEVNEELFQDVNSRILRGGADTPSVAEINGLGFEGADGERLRSQLTGLLGRRLGADIFTDTSPMTYIETKKFIHTNKITTLTTPFTLRHEIGQEGFAKTVSFTEGKSIIERAGVDGGYNSANYTELANLIIDRNNADKSADAALKKEQMDAFQDFVNANETRIKGYSGLASLDLSAPLRFYDFTVFMQNRYLEEIEKGANYRDLLNPRDVENYILREPDKFALPFADQIKLVGGQFKEDQPELSDIAPPPRLPNETPSAYQARTKDYWDSPEWQQYQSLKPQETQ